MTEIRKEEAIYMKAKIAVAIAALVSLLLAGGAMWTWR
jgi:hypothetical protein